MGEKKAKASDKSALQKEWDARLMRAAKRADEARVREALARGASPNATEAQNEGHSPKEDLTALVQLLTYGFEKGKKGEVGALRALLEAGANAAPSRSTEVFSPWECAARFEAPPEAIALMIQWGAPLGSKDRRKRTALHHAAKAGQTEKALALLEAGESAFALDWEGLSPAALALKSGKRAVAGAIAVWVERSELEKIARQGAPKSAPRL